MKVTSEIQTENLKVQRLIFLKNKFNKMKQLKAAFSKTTFEMQKANLMVKKVENRFNGLKLLEGATTLEMQKTILKV